LHWANSSSEAGAIILKIAYGYTIEPYKADTLVDLAKEVIDQLSAAATPGAWLVDTIPICETSLFNPMPIAY
jgi:hypothetical protein